MVASLKVASAFTRPFRPLHMLRPLLIGLLVVAALPAAAQTQSEMSADACAARDVADADLNTTYRAALAATATPLARQRLRDAQRAWLRFRDAEVAALFPLASGSDPRVAYGSVYPMRLCGEQARLTEARTVQLREHARCAAGGDPTCM